jgi:predicted double-glycine peptidase
MSNQIQLKFDNHSYLLTEEIYNRNGKKSKFEEWELWYLLLGLISAHQEVKTKTGERLGDVRPHNIFLNAQAEMKIANVYSWPRESTNFNKTFDNEKTYLAPEDMVRL